MNIQKNNRAMARIYNELRNYQNIPRELVFDKTLSDRARFVYVFMACKPDGWDFFLEPMSKDIGYSVDTLRKYLNELVASGWLVKGEQSNEHCIFGAVEYTLKAIKFTDTEKLRYGKNMAQENIDNISLPNNTKNIFDKEIKKEEKEYKEKFAEFVSAYKKMGGKSRGIDTEYKDFTKRHKDWQKVLPYLELAVQRETKARNQAKAQKKFFPEPKMLQTYLGKQRAWELYVTVGEDIKTDEYTPICDGALSWSDDLNCYVYVGMYYGHVSDGYTDENRPNGAKIMLGNGGGFIVWDKEKKVWNKI